MSEKDFTVRNGSERVAILEAHMSDQDKVLSGIVTDIKEIKVIVQKQDGYENRLTRLESSSNLWKWLNPLLAFMLGSILNFLLINYLQHLK